MSWQKPKLLIAVSICTYLCFLALIWVAKRPLCIDSMVVQKIDRVSATLSEAAFACHLNRSVVYSTDLDSYIKRLSPAIEKTVAVLNSIKPFKNKIQISIREDRPLMFEVQKNRIQIGSQFVSLDYHLNRALIKVWIWENRSSSKIDTALFEESMTDFLLYIIAGKIELEDPVDKVRTKLGAVKWPQVIKTTKGYCTSAWKYAEHVEKCDTNQDATAAVYSLRPLLTSALINGYGDLKYQQRNALVQNLGVLISSVHLASDKAIESILTDANPLHNGIININKFTDLILSATPKKRSEIYQFYTAVTQQLQLHGVTDTFAEAYFDYILDYDGRIDSTSMLYKSLEQAASQNPGVQVALKDAKNIWILPSKTALPTTVFDQIQSRQTLLVGCENIKNIQINQFFKKTEKLMLINNCDQNAQFDFNVLFKNGVKSFITKNAKINFIQLHLPSLEMIQADWDGSQNYFDLVKNRDITKKEFKTLGWSQVQWRKDLQAYRPEAVIEAIEYFRN